MLTAPSCHSDSGEWQAGSLCQLIVSVFSCEWVSERGRGEGEREQGWKGEADLQSGDGETGVLLWSVFSSVDVQALFHSQTLSLPTHTYTHSTLGAGSMTVSRARAWDGDPCLMFLRTHCHGHTLTWCPVPLTGGGENRLNQGALHAMVNISNKGSILELSCTIRDSQHVTLRVVGPR